jgi:hypothetical protein
VDKYKQKDIWGVYNLVIWSILLIL